MDTGHRIIRPLIRSIAALSLLCAAAPSAQQQPALELLSPGDAFRLEATRIAPAQVRLIWTIAPGYYLYRDRFRFENSSGAALRTLRVPPGLPKDDPYFGKTEIFRDRVVIDVGLDSPERAAAVVSLRIISQGCADIGICFPPQTNRLKLTTDASSVVTPVDDWAADRANPVLPAAEARYPLVALSDLSAGKLKTVPPFIRVGGSKGLDAMLTEAKRRGVPALLDVYADRCIPCRKMTAHTLSAPMVRDALADTLLLRADVSANLITDTALLRRFGLTGPPAILFFNSRGEEQAGHRVFEFMEPAPFARRVRDAIR